MYATFKYQILTIQTENLQKGPRPETIALILKNVGFLRRIGPKKRFGTKHTAVSARTITEICERTGINQTRLKPIMRDLSDSQLIDAALQQTTFRRAVEDYEPNPNQYSIPKWEIPEPEETPVPEGLTPSEEFEYRVLHTFLKPSPIPQRDIYLRFYRTELGQEWLDHYARFPNSTKRLREIQEGHRLSKLPKTRWDWIFEQALGLKPETGPPRET